MTQKGTREKLNKKQELMVRSWVVATNKLDKSAVRGGYSQWFCFKV